MKRGINLCRGREFERGYLLLRSVVEDPGKSVDLPGAFYSHLGFGIAAFESRYNDGVSLCQRAVEMEFYNVENHYNLARTYMLLGARRRAVAAIREGLRIDPEYRPLRVLLSELGVRKRPPLGFLGRNHPVNRVLGMIRHSFSGRPSPSKDE